MTEEHWYEILKGLEKTELQPIIKKLDKKTPISAQLLHIEKFIEKLIAEHKVIDELLSRIDEGFQFIGKGGAHTWGVESLNGHIQFTREDLLKELDVRKERLTTLKKLLKEIETYGK